MLRGCWRAWRGARVLARSGDDITNICRDAAMNGMRRNIAGRSPAEIKKLRELGQVRG